MIGSGLGLSSRRLRLYWLAGALALMIGGSATPVSAQGEPEAAQATQALRQLGIELPAHISNAHAIRMSLATLGREKCDQQAVLGLGDQLQKQGYRREAATALVNFSRACGGYPAGLRSAVNYLLTLSDYGQAVSTASELIKLEPQQDNGYYLRAVAQDRGGDPRRAIDDYQTAIELFAHKDRISSVGYFAIARLSEKIGLPCDAVGAVNAWIAANPARNDNSQSQRLIAQYTSAGGCKPSTANNTESFAAPRPGNVVRLPVTINGVKGTFILDTGASFVALNDTFAAKAGVDIDTGSSIKLFTANGVTEGKRGRAKSIQLRSLQAQDVAVVVQKDSSGTYGAGVDGLLGMSFLSRFSVKIDGTSVKIGRR